MRWITLGSVSGSFGEGMSDHRYNGRRRQTARERSAGNGSIVERAAVACIFSEESLGDQN
jgi:hypothetical protein